MTSPIIAVSLDGGAVWADKEPYAVAALRTYVNATADLVAHGVPASLSGQLVAFVTRARTASAVAHEHARRLVAAEEALCPKTVDGNHLLHRTVASGLCCWACGWVRP